MKYNSFFNNKSRNVLAIIELCFNPLQREIGKHILQTDLYKPPMVLI